MKSLTDSLKKTLAHRHMGHQMIWAIALNSARDFFVAQGWLSVDEAVLLQGFVRFKTLSLSTLDQSLKINIFKQKNQILHEVNLALAKVGYATKIDTIRMKP